MFYLHMRLVGKAGRMDHMRLVGKAGRMDHMRLVGKAGRMDHMRLVGNLWPHGIRDLQVGIFPYYVIRHGNTNIIQILDGGESTIQFTGRRKAIMDEALPRPLSLF